MIALFPNSQNDVDHSQPEATDPTISDTSSPEALTETSADHPVDGTSVDRPSDHDNSSLPAKSSAVEPEVSPYVARILANMPPPVQAPEGDDSSRHEDPEEWEQRRAWREEQRTKLEQEVQRVDKLLGEAKEAEGHTQPSN